MANIVRPDVSVDQHPINPDGTGPNVTDVVVSRDGKGRSYRGVGTSEVERTKSIVRQIVDDPYTGEWIDK